jgi:excisionase family DNA binding protein
MGERLLKPMEVALRLGLRRTACYGLLGSGALPVIRLNPRVVRVRESDLDEWVRRGCPMPGEQPEPAAAGR